jgi:hypothetical protein
MPRHQGIDGLDHEEKYHQCDDQEANHRVQEGPNLEFTVVDGKSINGEINLAKYTNQRGDEVGNKSVDNGSECYTNDDTNGQVYNVTTQDEGFEIVQRTFGTPSNILYVGIVPHRHKYAPSFFLCFWFCYSHTMSQ